jgi:hypothetical protein
MNFYTEEAVQELANKRGKPICAWVPCHDRDGEHPVPKDQFKWVIDPHGNIKVFESNPKGAHAQRKVFRPCKD